MIFTSILKIIGSYWKPLVFALLIASTFYYKTALSTAVKEHKDYMTAQAAAVDSQKAADKIKVEAANILSDNRKSSYEAEITLRDLDRVKLKKDLENEKSNIDAMLATAYQLRLDSASSRTASKVSAATAIPAGSRADSNTIATIIEACKLTTLNYNTLHQAWVDNCAIYGCE